jgi:deoxyribodipyrimidine photo-lyase
VLEKNQTSSLNSLSDSSSAHKFLDELITWRELGLNMAHFCYLDGKPLGRLEAVTPWALESLEKHMGGSHSVNQKVSLEDLENARSPDPIWNAAQRELLQTGVIHNYMRMIWGKGIIRWSANPAEAFARMEWLNNRYALDGRDPNSYTGIYWCLGKFDRPWPPARPPFGLVRSMTTASARKKLSMEFYLGRFDSAQS